MKTEKELEGIEEIKKDIEKKLCELVSYVNREYASPTKKDLLLEIDKKIKFYLENKDLQVLILLNEFVSGIMVGFRR